MLAFHAIADPTRRAILELIAREGATAASAVSAQFAMTPSAISQHLKLLVEGGLLTRESKGQQRIYRINPLGLQDIEKWLARTRWFWEQSMVGGEGFEPTTKAL